VKTLEEVAELIDARPLTSGVNPDELLECCNSSVHMSNVVFHCPRGGHFDDFGVLFPFGGLYCLVVRVNSDRRRIKVLPGWEIIVLRVNSRVVGLLVNMYVAFFPCDRVLDLLNL